MRFLRGPLVPLGIALAAGLLGDSLVQSQCTTSSDANFDFEVAVDDDFTIRWTVDTDAEEASFGVVYDGEGWVSLGFSANGQMVPADAVIGLPDETDGPLEYILVEYDVVPDEHLSFNQEISAANVSQVDSVTSLTFTRPLSPSDTNKTALSAVEGEQTILIWAFGSSNELAFHQGWGNTVLSDLFCTAELAAEEDVDTSVEYCTSTDPDFEFQVSPATDLTLFWIVSDDESSVSVKAVYEGEGYLGIGFSDSGFMPGSDAVVGLPDEGIVSEYDMDSYSTPAESADQEISDATITQADGVTTLTFVRPLEPTGDGKQILTVSDPTSWLYAMGGSNEFVFHAVEGAFSIRLDSCDVTSAGGGTTREYAHGWLMVLGWTVCFPAGIMFGRFSKSYKDLGFPAHRLLQSLGSLLVVAGFIVAIAFTEDKGLDHFTTAHGSFGLLLVIFVMLQVVAAVFRPSKPAPGAVVQDGSGQSKPAPASKARIGWQWLHVGLGYLAVILAVFQSFGGLDAVEAGRTWATLLLVLVILVVVSFVALQAYARVRKRRDDVLDYSRPQHTAEEYPTTIGTHLTGSYPTTTGTHPTGSYPTTNGTHP